MTGRGVVRWLLTSRRGGVLIASVAAGAASAVVTNTYLSKKLDKQYSEISDREIEQAKLFYRRQNKEGEFADPAALAAQYDDAVSEDDEELEDPAMARESALVAQAVTIMEKQGYTPYSKREEVVPPTPEEVIEVTTSIKNNLWEEQQKRMDPETGIDIVDVAERKEIGRPYIISEQEFLENAQEWQERTLTWFELDGVLVDEAENPLREVDRIVDLDNLRFGVGSKSTNVVYVANPQDQGFYEITRSPGSYSEEVLDIPYERGSRKPPIAKMRREE